MKKIMTFLLGALFLLTFGAGANALTNPGAADEANGELAVKNSDGEYVGTVSNALADPMGNITFVILSLGGNQGEQKEVVVPVYAFSQDGDSGLMVNMSNAQLAAAPEFHMSDLSDPTFGDRVYRYYGQVPPWSEGAPGGNSEE